MTNGNASVRFQTLKLLDGLYLRGDSSLSKDFNKGMFQGIYKMIISCHTVKRRAHLLVILEVAAGILSSEERRKDKVGFQGAGLE